MNLKSAIAELKAQRSRIDNAVEVLSELTGPSRKPKRISAKGRRAIAKGQRARWAKYRQENGK